MMTRTFLDHVQRELIGFQNMFKNLETPLYPPHNVLKTEDGYSIEIAVAGFQKHEVTVTQDPEMGIVVEGIKPKTEDHTNYLYQGIALRKFRKCFPIAPHIKVIDVVLEDGMLYIDLEEVTKTNQLKFEVR